MFSVALGVALGLILFAVMFLGAMWVWDKIGARKQAKAERTKQQEELEGLRTKVRQQAQTISRHRIELTTLRNQIRKAPPKRKEKPAVPRPSSWARLTEA